MSIDELRVEDIWRELKERNERWLSEYYRRNCVLDAKWECIDGKRNSCEKVSNTGH